MIPKIVRQAGQILKKCTEDADEFDQFIFIVAEWNILLAIQLFGEFMKN
jgi:hypothetical protein